MSDRTLLVVGLAVGLVTLYVSLRMAVALMRVEADANKTISDVKASPLGPVLGFLGLK